MNPRMEVPELHNTNAVPTPVRKRKERLPHTGSGRPGSDIWQPCLNVAGTPITSAAHIRQGDQDVCEECDKPLG